MGARTGRGRRGERRCCKQRRGCSTLTRAPETARRVFPGAGAVLCSRRTQGNPVARRRWGDTMLFNSYTFVFLFLPLTALGFWGLASRVGRRAAIAWLVLCSLFFYAYWNPVYLALLGVSIAMNFGIGYALGGGDAHTRGRQGLLALGVAGNLGLLGYFKYANFFVDTLNDLTGATVHLAPIMLPLAISFFTFQQIAYLIDAYKGLTSEHNFLDYCLFVTFFPQLIAGPIVHHKEMLPQFARHGAFHFDPENVSAGATMFLIGLCKKVVLADSVAQFANPVFDGAFAGQPPAFAAAWLGSLAYTFQLYFDFSGYSDMAVGLGRIFGIRLPLNFNSPYKSRNFLELWRRWHMTLSRFLRDYLYIPLGGGKRGPSRRALNLLITMLLGGLWHGAAWTFVFWGGLMWFYVVVNALFDRFCKRLGIDRYADRPAWVQSARALTFLAAMFSLVFFRSADFATAGSVIKGLAGLNGFSLATGFDLQDAVWWNLGLLAIVWFAPNTAQIMTHFKPVLAWAQLSRDWPPVPRWLGWLKWRPAPGAAIAVGLLAVVVVMSMSRIKEFLYFQF